MYGYVIDQQVYFLYWFLKYFLPAMIANATPVLVRGSSRIDFSKKFIDGKPLFGQNKTWEGFFTGVIMGSLTGLSIALMICDPAYFIVVGIGTPISALIGDLIGSFVKRRLSIKSGDPLPVIDQLDFAVLSTIYLYLAGVEEFIAHPDYILYSLLIILVLHIITNNIAYYIGVKDKRW